MFDRVIAMNFAKITAENFAIIFLFFLVVYVAGIALGSLVMILTERRMRRDKAGRSR